MSTEPQAIQVREAAEVTRPSDLLGVIAAAVADPRMDVEKMERLLAMHERITAEKRKQAYDSALAELQARVPQIHKDGRIVVKGVERSKYAKLETIDKIIRPLLSEYGFSLAFDSQSHDGKVFTLSCRLSHKDGHSETKALVLPIDKSDYRSDVQSIGSTVSYGRRQLIKMHLNIIEVDEDDDGNGGTTPITDQQAVDIQSLLEETKADKRRFLDFMGVESVDKILSRDFRKAINALESKKRGRR